MNISLCALSRLKPGVTMAHTNPGLKPGVINHNTLPRALARSTSLIVINLNLFERAGSYKNIKLKNTCEYKTSTDAYERI